MCGVGTVIVLQLPMWLSCNMLLSKEVQLVSSNVQLGASSPQQLPRCFMMASSDAPASLCARHTVELVYMLDYDKQLFWAALLTVLLEVPAATLPQCHALFVLINTTDIGSL